MLETAIAELNTSVKELTQTVKALCTVMSNASVAAPKQTRSRSSKKAKTDAETPPSANPTAQAVPVAQPTPQIDAPGVSVANPVPTAQVTPQQANPVLQQAWSQQAPALSPLPSPNPVPSPIPASPIPPPQPAQPVQATPQQYTKQDMLNAAIAIYNVTKDPNQAHAIAKHFGKEHIGELDESKAAEVIAKCNEVLAVYGQKYQPIPV